MVNATTRKYTRMTTQVGAADSVIGNYVYTGMPDAQ